jgi:CarD family transcriptional regulator
MKPSGPGRGDGMSDCRWRERVVRGIHYGRDRVKGPPVRHEEPKEQFPAVEGVIADAGDLAPGDRVVYPNQGVCRITGVEVQEIAGQRLDLVRMEREEDGAAVLVPRGKVPTIGLRKVASGEQIEGVFHYLAAQYDDPELDWKVRHRDNADRLIAGGVLGVAEVVKGLHALSRIRPLPTKEREQYDNARHLLVHEVAVSLGVPPALAEDYVDYALMPPVGVTFKLKPPPKPVELPVRPRRKPVPVAESDDDLGLDELGLDLGVDALAEGADGEEAAVASPEEEAAGAGGEDLAPEVPAPDAPQEPEDRPSPDEEVGEEEPPRLRRAAAPGQRARDVRKPPAEAKPGLRRGRSAVEAPPRKAAVKAAAAGSKGAARAAPKKAAAPARPERAAREGKAVKTSKAGATKKTPRGSKKK